MGKISGKSSKTVRKQGFNKSLPQPITPLLRVLLPVEKHCW